MQDVTYYQYANANANANANADADAFQRRVSILPAGGMFILLAIACAAVGISRQALWYFGVPIPLRIVTASCTVFTLFFLSLATWRISSSLAALPSGHLFGPRLLLLCLWVFCLAIYGFIADNLPSDVFKEAAGWFVLVLLCLLGRRDAVWQRVRKPLVVVFYVAFILILLTYKVPHIVTTFERSEERRVAWDSRNIATIGYSIRPIMELGLFLGAWGLVQRRTDRWRILMVGALGVYFVVNVLIFGFRGSAVALVELIAVFTLLRPIAQGKLHGGTIAATFIVGGIGIAIASQTNAFSKFTHRLSEGDLFESRISEAKAFFEDMNSFELMIGRGLGGSYIGPHWAPVIVINGRPHWVANHFGFLHFVLIGGFLFLAFIATFVVPIIFRRSREWYDNEYNLAAFTVMPIIIYSILCDPIVIDTDSFFTLLVVGFCFARFSTAVGGAREPATLSTY